MTEVVIILAALLISESLSKIAKAIEKLSEKVDENESTQNRQRY